MQCALKSEAPFNLKWLDVDGDPISVDCPREWDEAIRLYMYNQETELLLHGGWAGQVGVGMRQWLPWLQLSGVTDHVIAADVRLQSDLCTLPHTSHVKLDLISQHERLSILMYVCVSSECADIAAAFACTLFALVSNVRTRLVNKCVLISVSVLYFKMT